MVEMRGRLRTSWYVCLIGSLLAGALVAVARPATVNASGVVGDGTSASCTEAALDAVLDGGGAVSFNCGDAPVTIRLTSTIIVEADTSIDGGGRVTLSGNRARRVLQVNQDVTLDLDDITIADGAAMEGSGIYVDRGTLNVRGSTFTNNRGPCCTPSSGGAIFNNNGTVTIDRSTLSGSYVGGSGANLYNYNGTVTISNSTIAGGQSNNGGGIFNFGQRGVEGHTGETATITITNTTFANNSGSGGGAIFNFGYIDGTYGTARISISNSTLVGNFAGSGGSAVFTNGGTTIFHNSIIANNQGVGANSDCRGPVSATSSTNLSDDIACGSSFTQVSTSSLQLGTLASNGGPTQTVALGSGSVAIDAGNATICALDQPDGPGGVDQRGAARTGICDIGAYERGIGTSVTVSSSLNPANVGESVTFTADVSASSGVPDGSVTFKDGASTLGTVALDGNGQASFSTSSLSGGTHSITAVYIGSQSSSSNFDGSTSPVLTQVVTTVVYPLNVSLSGSGSGNVTSSPSGINCGVDCAQEYDEGTVVTLAAVAASGSVFAGWSGACSNATGTCSVTMDAARTVMAMFADANQPPVAEAGADQTVDEGASVTLDGSGSSDPDTDSLSYRWSVSGADCPAVTLSPSTNVVNPGFVATDNGVCVFQVTVDDGNGGTDTDDVTVTIDNVAPNVVLSDPTIQSTGSAVRLEGSFTDAGVLDTHTAVFDWGDGTTSDGTIVESDGSGTVSGTHIYARPGLYNVALTVTDKDGAAGVASYSGLIVVASDGGKVVGAGVFTSPSGAYPTDPSFVGQGGLYVNVEQKTGATTPRGHVQVQLVQRPGRPELMLMSSGLEWLVVDGDRAWMTGTATQLRIPGLWKSSQSEVEYGFLISIIDGEPGRRGEPDLVRLKLWETATGTVIYDSQMGASAGADPAAPLWYGEVLIR